MAIRMRCFFALLALAGSLSASAQNLTQTTNFLGLTTPQFMGSGTSTRLPIVFRARLAGLTANTTYRYYTQAAVTSTLGTAASGAGNPMLIATNGATYTYSTGPSLTTAGNYETFVTDGNGQYTGWFAFVNTGNANFTGGNVVLPTITIGNTSGTLLNRWALIQGVKVLAFSASAGANNGTAIVCTNSGGTAKNFVALYDDTAGANPPLTITYLESEGTSVASAAAFYGAAGTGPVDGRAGAWGAIVPNSLANGVRRVAQFDASGTLVSSATDADGVWPSGTNTVNPAGGTTPIQLQTTDASLTAAPSITVTAGTMAFTNVVAGDSSGEQTYTVSGANLTGNITNVAPAGFQISTNSGTGFGSSLVLTQNAGVVVSTLIYVRFVPSAVQSYSGSITHDSPGATQQTKALTGTGTLAAEPTTHASSLSFASVTTNQMTASWSAGNGASRLIVAAAGSAPNTAPVDGTAYAANSAYGSGTALGNGYVVYSGSGTSVALTALQTSNSYYLTIYEYNGSGVALNYLTSGSPASGNRATLAAEPTVQASGLGFANVTATNFDVSFTAGNGGQRIVVAHQGAAVDAAPVDGTTYTANATFGSGTQLGSGNYVVYVGSGTGFTLTGLAPATTYYLAVYELNGSAGLQNYAATAPATGSQATGAGSVAPSVVSPSVSAITTTGATLGATVASDGGSALLARGTVWGTSAAPTGNALDEGGTGVSSFTHARTGMPAGTLIYFRGYAANAIGTNFTADSTFWTVPNAPAANAASGIGATFFTANWTPATGATNYLVDVATDSGFTGLVSGYNSRVAGNVSSLSVTGLSLGTAYYTRIRAQNAGGVSTNSGTVNLTTLDVPTVTTPTVTAITNNGATLGATISANGGSALLERGTVWGTTAAPTGNRLADGGTAVAAFSHARTGMSAGTLIYFRGYASNAVGIAYSADGSFYTSPDAPAVSAASSLAGSSFIANWSTAVSATNYLLDVATDTGFVSMVSGYNGYVAGSNVSATVSGLAAGTPHFYRLRAQNAGGISTNSATVGATTLVIRTVSELFVPQFIEGGLSSNSNRTPYAFFVTLGGFTPNTSYNYTLGCITNGDLSTANGAGNAIYVTNGANFVRSTGQSLATPGNYGSFLTDGSGAYSGWFIVEPTGNGRFATAGNTVYVRLVFNDGAGGTAAHSSATLTNAITVLAYASSGANSGSGLRGTSSGTAKNFVVAFDNTYGSGRPLAAAPIESDGVTAPTTGSASYVPFYGAFVDGVAGSWGTIIPNALPNGVRRLEQRALTDGSLIFASTDTDGTWPSGVNTVSPSAGTNALFITSSDAPLAVTLPNVNFTASTITNQGENGGSVTVSVQLSSAATGTVQIASVGTATLGSDFSLSATTITFSVANSTQTLTITVVDDAVIESTETVSLNLTNATGLTATSPTNFSFSILDNDATSVRFDAATNAPVLESAGPVTVNVQVSQQANATVDISAAGSAHLGSDYTLSATQFVFTSSGPTSQTLTVTLLDDTTPEATESLSLSFTNARGLFMTDFTNFQFQITDNEPVIQWTTSAVVTAEGSGTVQLVVSKTAPINTVTAQVLVAGSAALGTDFTLSTTNVVLDGATTSQTITVNIADDGSIEGSENFTLSLTNAAQASIGTTVTVTVTINDNDFPPVLQPGDLAVVGRINNGTPDSYAIVALTNIQPGTVVYFTDNGWSNALFRGASTTDGDGNENLARLIFSNTVAAGTILQITNSTTAAAWTTNGTIASGLSGSFAINALNAGGDQIYIFQGDATNPLLTASTHVFVFDDTAGFENAAGTGDGAMPPGLSSNANTAVSLPFGSSAFAAINMSKAASNTLTTKAGWLAFINNTGNWVTGASGALPGGTLNYGQTCDAGLPPRVATAGSTTVAGGGVASFTVTANDPTCIAPALSATGLPAGATFSAIVSGTNRVGTFSWTTTTNNYGVHPVRFTATDGTLSTTIIVRVYVAQPGESNNNAGVPVSLTNWVVPITNLAHASSGNATLVWSSASGLPYDLYVSSNTPGSGAMTWSLVGSLTAATASAAAVVPAGGTQQFFSVALAGESPSTNGLWAAIRPKIAAGFTLFSAPVVSDGLLNGAFGSALASSLTGDNGGIGDAIGDELHLLQTNGIWQSFYLDGAGVWRGQDGTVATNRLTPGQGAMILRYGATLYPEFLGAVGNTGTSTNDIREGWNIVGLSEGRLLYLSTAFDVAVAGAPVGDYDEAAADLFVLFNRSSGSWRRYQRLPTGIWMDLSTFTQSTENLVPGEAGYYLRTAGSGVLSVRF